MVKRILDLAGCVLGAVAAAPVMALAAVWVRLTMGAPVFFRQARTGLHGEIFTLFKFRTMAGDDRRPDAERITVAGEWLRRLSIDELPQLWNVLRCEMSLVGPRPLLPEYLPRYSEFQRRRHEVKPGLTGWAQIHGRNELSWERKFELDVWYVDHRTLALDLKILLATVARVLGRKGISQAGHATAEKFCPEAGEARGALAKLPAAPLRTAVCPAAGGCTASFETGESA